MENTNYEKIINAICQGSIELTVALLEEHINSSESVNATEIISQVFIPAMERIDVLFEQGSLFITDVIISSKAIQEGFKKLKAMDKTKFATPYARVVIGTIEGDIHDIGKNIMKMVLEASGFDAIDLGVDVSPKKFLEAATFYKPDVVCISALLSSCKDKISETVKTFQEAGISDTRIIVGGAPFTRQVAEDVNVDGYATDAFDGIKLIKSLVEKKLCTASTYSHEVNLTNLDGFCKTISQLLGIEIALHHNHMDTRDYHKISNLKLDNYLDYLDQGIINLGYVNSCDNGYAELIIPVFFKEELLSYIVAGHFELEMSKNTAAAPCLLNGSSKAEITIEKISNLNSIINILKELISAKAEKLLINTQVNNYYKYLHSFVQKQSQLELLAKDAELKALQAQVNPHFLFNTLNTIANVALFEKASKTHQLLNAIAKLLRYTLQSVANIVTINDEVKIINSYLFIQSFRYNDRLQYNIGLDDSIKHAKIPCMIIQPLVENAIIHGVEPLKIGGRVDIIIQLVNDYINIFIKDTGVGIPSNKIEEINRLKIDKTGTSQVTGLGIDNVYRRLVQFFGSECSLEIKKNEPKGTCIKIVLPFIE
ncbi:histidine kinase [Desulfitibacter alkalitolerans]|uniref:histidine kinase n=1 Tax=Desulfitibacter alkalitolerans TaxID=264641 RepID=UPI000684E1BA|nr:histidine kinase [Desulfitibacter alkalitolerans]